MHFVARDSLSIMTLELRSALAQSLPNYELSRDYNMSSLVGGRRLSVCKLSSSFLNDNTPRNILLYQRWIEISNRLPSDRLGKSPQECRRAARSSKRVSRAQKWRSEQRRRVDVLSPLLEQGRVWWNDVICLNSTSLSASPDPCSQPANGSFLPSHVSIAQQLLSIHDQRHYILVSDSGLINQDVRIQAQALH